MTSWTEFRRWSRSQRWPWQRARPSRTSQVVALVRAGLSRPQTPDGDPGAQARLCAGMRPAGDMPLRDQLAARTQFFDEQVLAALGRGIRQVVILGAGYDDRALRFRSPRTRFIELDEPGAQADKADRLRAVGAGPDGVVLAPADFRDDDVAAVLAAAGHDTVRPTLFLCEAC
jgi:methyltransferase (TIGR00027 family)